MLGLSAPAPVRAATLPSSWTYACSGDSDPAACERLTYIAGQEAELDDLYQAVCWGIGVGLFLCGLPFLTRLLGRET